MAASIDKLTLSNRSRGPVLDPTGNGGDYCRCQRVMAH